MMRGISTRQWFWIILLISVGVRSSFIYLSHQYLVLNEKTEEVAIGHALAEKMEFADPYMFPTGPTAHSAPFAPFLDSLYLRVFGETQLAEIVKEAVCTLVGSIVWALLPWTALQLGFARTVGIWAGLFFGGVPLHPNLETKGEWEAVWAALACLLLLALFLRTWGRSGFAIQRGLAVGAALYIQPNLLPVVVLWTFLELWVVPPPARSRLVRDGILLLLVVAASQSLWVYRNWVVLGAPVWPRSNLGLELACAYNNDATITAEEATRNGSLAFRHPNGSSKEAQAVRQEGEVGYNQKKMAFATQWILLHPARAIALTFGRVFRFWFPVIPLRSKYVLLWLVTLLGWAGLFRLWRVNHSAAGLILLMWIGYPLVNYIVLNSIRLSYPIFWSEALLAAFFLWSLRRPKRTTILTASPAAT